MGRGSRLGFLKRPAHSAYPQQAGLKPGPGGSDQGWLLCSEVRRGQSLWGPLDSVSRAGGHAAGNGLSPLVAD